MGKVFVGGLSRETTTVGLRGYFERFGDISDCVVMKDRSTGAPRGFGFVTFASQQIADRVVLHRHIIDGKEVEAKPAVPREAETPMPPRDAAAPPLPGGAPMPPQSLAPPPAASGFAPPPPSAPHSNDFSSKKIFVGGLSHDTSEQDFIGYFSATRRVSPLGRAPRAPLAPPPHWPTPLPSQPQAISARSSIASSCATRTRVSRVVLASSPTIATSLSTASAATSSTI